jgi:spermidine synthase
MSHLYSNSGECQWLHLNLIKSVLDSSRKTYKAVAYAWASVPTYPSGQIGFILCSNEERDFKVPARSFPPEFEKAKLKYYNQQVHSAAFVLPQFAANVLNN